MRALPFLALLFSVGTANANGRLPQANQLVIAETDPQTLVLRATFGFLRSIDHGKSWDWICESAIPFSGIQDPAIGITGNKTILAGVIEGLSVSPDQGCSWAFATAVGKQQVIDLSVQPKNPSRAVAITNTFVDGGYDSRVYQTTNDGTSFAAIGMGLDPADIVETIDITASGRLYVSTKQLGAQTTGWLLVSDDDGKTWLRHSIPLTPNEVGVYIAAVDPADPTRVYLRTLDASQPVKQSRLLVTKDSGVSYEEKWKGNAMLGFAVNASGRVYLGSIEDGLFAASAVDLVFTKRSSLPVTCLTASGSELFVCSTETVGPYFSLAVTHDEGATFIPLFKLSGIRGPLSCPAGTQTAKCAAEWADLAERFGVYKSDPGSEPILSEPEPTSSKCGCTASTGAPSILAALAWLALRARRKTQGRRT